MPSDADSRKSQILAAAASCFARRGFHQTTMDDISRQAGISVGLIYRHYGGKDDLILALAQAYERDSLTRLERARKAPAILETIEVLLGIGEASDTPPEAGALAIEVMAEALRNTQVATVLRRGDDALATGLTGLLRTAQERGEADPSLPPEAAAQLLLALADGLLLRHSLAEDGETDAPQALLSLAHLLCRRFLMATGDGGDGHEHD